MSKTRVFFLSLLLSLSAPLFAEVQERRITLPDDLGSAVLYEDTDNQQRTAGIIVVHEWWGLNDYARDRARQLAEQGYVAVAVDMYGHGKVATHPKDATAFMEAAFAEPEKMNARFNAARDVLLTHKQVDGNRLFAVGYCFGGAVVLNQARQGSNLAGVASFHGSLGTKTPAKPGEIKARLLVATGEADPMVPPSQVAAFVEEMIQAGAHLQLLAFPGARHSFTNPGATAVGKKHDMPLAYDAAADRQSWQALLDFLSADID